MLGVCAAVIAVPALQVDAWRRSIDLPKLEDEEASQLRKSLKVRSFVSQTPCIVRHVYVQPFCTPQLEVNTR